MSRVYKYTYIYSHIGICVCFVLVEFDVMNISEIIDYTYI